VRVGLLDVNALIALLWAEHPFHKACVEWFRNARQSGWATCPITEAGFVRVVCNPAFTARPPSVDFAIKVLKTATESNPNHHFWADDLPISVLPNRWKGPLGHKQVTDAYLLSLAEYHNGSLITFDQRILHFASAVKLDRETLRVLKL
jgi:toxin-antitoxin system PIN domain toxin